MARLSAEYPVRRFMGLVRGLRSCGTGSGLAGAVIILFLPPIVVKDFLPRDIIPNRVRELLMAMLSKMQIQRFLCIQHLVDLIIIKEL